MCIRSLNHLESIGGEIFSKTEMPDSQAQEQEFRTSCVQLLDCGMKDECINPSIFIYSLYIYILSFIFLH